MAPLLLSAAGALVGLCIGWLIGTRDSQVGALVAIAEIAKPWDGIERREPAPIASPMRLAA